METPEAKQPFEVKATQIDVEGTSTPDYPLQKKRHSVEFLREIAYLRPRTNLFSATFRVRSLIAMAIHEFFQGKGFVYAHTPIITGSDCEGAGEMFRVTTLDLDNLPRTADGKVGLFQRLLRPRKPTLPYPVSFPRKPLQWRSAMFIPSGLPSVRKIPTQPDMRRNSG